MNEIILDFSTMKIEDGIYMAILDNWEKLPDGKIITHFILQGSKKYTYEDEAFGEKPGKDRTGIRISQTFYPTEKGLRFLKVQIDNVIRLGRRFDEEGIIEETLNLFRDEKYGCCIGIREGKIEEWYNANFYSYVGD